MVGAKREQIFSHAVPNCCAAALWVCASCVKCNPGWDQIFISLCLCHRESTRRRRGKRSRFDQLLSGALPCSCNILIAPIHRDSSISLSQREKPGLCWASHITWPRTQGGIVSFCVTFPAPRRNWTKSLKSCEIYCSLDSAWQAAQRPLLDHLMRSADKSANGLVYESLCREKKNLFNL